MTDRAEVIALIDELIIAVDDRLAVALKGDLPGHEFHGNQWTKRPSNESDEHLRDSTIKAIEESISTISDHEQGHVISNSGEIVLSKEGGDTYIVFDDDELAKMNNATLIHNHPSGRSFSIEDIVLASAHNLREVRAVGVAEKFTYIMRPRDPARGWPPVETIMAFAHNHEVEVFSDLNPKVRSGALSAKDAEIIHQHRIWTLVANDYNGALNLEYIRIVGQ